MGADIIAMGMGMRSMSWGEALFPLGVVRRVRGGMIGRVMFFVFDVPLPVLAIGFSGMVGSIALLSWGHTLYFAFIIIKKIGRRQENREKIRIQAPDTHATSLPSHEAFYQQGNLRSPFRKCRQPAAHLP